MTDWKLVCVNLLEHFQAMEGTTYLYDAREREAFVIDLPFSEDDKDEVQGFLRKWHEDSKTQHRPPPKEAAQGA